MTVMFQNSKIKLALRAQNVVLTSVYDLRYTQQHLFSPATGKETMLEISML